MGVGSRFGIPQRSVVDDEVLMVCCGLVGLKHSVNILTYWIEGLRLDEDIGIESTHQDTGLHFGATGMHCHDVMGYEHTRIRIHIRYDTD
jgi:hypothetical protein